MGYSMYTNSETTYYRSSFHYIQRRMCSYISKLLLYTWLHFYMG